MVFVLQAPHGHQMQGGGQACEQQDDLQQKQQALINQGSTTCYMEPVACATTLLRYGGTGVLGDFCFCCGWAWQGSGQQTRIESGRSSPTWVVVWWWWHGLLEGYKQPLLIRVPAGIGVRQVTTDQQHITTGKLQLFLVLPVTAAAVPATCVYQ